MLSLAIVLYALAHAGSPVLAGWLSFAAVAPGLVISPIAGALIDRAGAVWANSRQTWPPVPYACWPGAGGPDRLCESAGAVGVDDAVLADQSAGRRGHPHAAATPGAERGADRRMRSTPPSWLTDIVGPALAGLLMGSLARRPRSVSCACVSAGAALSIGGIRRVHARPGRCCPRYCCMGHLLHEALAGLVRRPSSSRRLRGLAICYGLYQITWGALVVLVPVGRCATLRRRNGRVDGGLAVGRLGCRRALWARSGRAAPRARAGASGDGARHGVLCRGDLGRWPRRSGRPVWPVGRLDG